MAIAAAAIGVNLEQLLYPPWADRRGGRTLLQENTVMPFMLLQIDFVDDRPLTTDKSVALTDLAHSIAQAPGLIWKIWTENPDTREAGGIYLFQDEATLEAYLTMHTERLRGMGIGAINAKKFQINAPLTTITHGGFAVQSS